MMIVDVEGRKSAAKTKQRLSYKDIIIMYAFNAVSSHGRLDVGQELIPILAHLQCSLCPMKYLISSVKRKVIPYLCSEDRLRLAPETSIVAQPSLN